MRITFVLPTVNLSGGIRVAAIHAKALARRGHTVRVVSPPPDVPSRRRKLKSWLNGNGWPSQKQPQSHLDGSGLDHHVLDRWRPVTDADVPDADVVIATWWETAEWVAALAPRKGAKAYFIQGHEVFDNLPTRSRDTYRLPLHKIVVARWLADVMCRDYGAEAVDVVPNSVDHEQFFAAPRGKQVSPTAGFLYSRSKVKGIDITVAALERLRTQFSDLRIVSFGSQPPDGSLSLPEGAEFYLAPPQDNIRHLYGRCDVWITASRSEGFNLPAMEAMACRTPVVATPTGWPKESIVTGRNGVLVAADAASVAQGTAWVFERSEEEWKALSASAGETAAAGSWQKSSEMFEESLNRALANTKALS